MAYKPIQQPPPEVVRTLGGEGKVVWNKFFAVRWNKALSMRQKIIDSECLRGCSAYVPKRTGALERSGIIGTVIGSGKIVYLMIYSAYQYYATATRRSYDPRRGGRWFERWKVANRRRLLNLLQQLKGGK